MSLRATISILLGTCFCFTASAFGQLSQNSGINSSDTWVTMDLTVTVSGSTTLPEAFYDPSTQATTDQLIISPAPRTFHVETGYDPNSKAVMNIFPTGTQPDPNLTDADVIGMITLAGGQMTVFGQDGSPITPVFPQGVPTSSMWASSFFGANSGPSVIQNLVVPDVGYYAADVVHAASWSGPT